MKRYLNILSIIALTLATFLCRDKNGRQFCHESVFTPDYENIHETEPHFIITPEKKIIFPANEDGKFKLIEYNKGRIKALNFPFDYVINPMMIGDEIAGLYDRNSDEKYRVTSGRIDKFLHARVIRSARSSPKGNYLLYVPEGQNELHMIDLTAMEDIFISRGVAKTNHICFDPSEKYFVFPQTDRVFLYDLHKKRLREVPTGLNGKKLNLYAVNDLLYFVNNDTSEFYNIYSVGLHGQKNKSEFVLALDRDLRLPKRQGDKLFFLGVDAGEYLLYCKNTKTGKVRQLTKRGVVFDYQFYGQKIGYSYGDFLTPKCLKILDIHTGKKNTVYGGEQDFGMTYSYIDDNRIRSGAWVFSPPDSVKTKGTVLYIHHGLHSDFSPRWENMLMGICLNGYRIITPNYPGSCGYGKSYKTKISMRRSGI